jgi:hypothetical protein
MIDRSQPLDIALVCTTTLREDSLTCDPALDLEHPDAGALLSAYAGSRAPADLAKLPLKKGGVLSLFTTLPLNSSALRFVKSALSMETRVQWLVQVGCHEFTDEKSETHKATQHGKLTDSADKKFKVASEDWLDFLRGRYGSAGLEELALVILDRAEASPRALAPFGLPPGSTLPR